LKKHAREHVNINIYLMKKKKKITVTINKEIMEKVDKLTTSRSRLVEYILVEYLTKNGIKTDDIIL